VKLLRTTLALAALLIGVPLIVATCMDSTWEVEARRTLDAPPASVHPWLDAVGRWRSWAVADAALLEVGTGPVRGPGARLHWGPSRLGPGRLELTASDPARGVWFDVHLGDDRHPIRGVILLAPAAAGTEVTLICRGDVGPDPLAKLALPWAKGELERGLASVLERLGRRVEAAD
jgi:hypothetical protein